MTTAAELRQQTILAWPEKKLQEQVIILARALGWELIYHTYDSRRSEPGFPDLVLVHPARGRILFRELKSSRGTVSADQRRWIAGLAACGSDIAVWRPSDFHSGLIEQELLP